MGRTRFTIAVAVCSLPLRCEYGFRGTKISPWFAAAPAKLKPATENVPSDLGHVCQHVGNLLADVFGVFQ